MNEENAGRVSEERAYLIRKGGAWYRPDSAGYTSNAHEAGLYTLGEAEKITHPNGPRGPRDAMSYHHRNTVPALALRAAVGVRELEWKESRYRGVPYNGPEVVRVWEGTAIDMRWATIIECTDGEFTLLSDPTCSRFPSFAQADVAAQADYRARILSCIEPLRPATEQAGGEVGDLERLAKDFHDGPLMADDHEFLPDSAQGKWCMEVAEFFASRLPPPSPAATQSAVVNDEMVERAAEAVFMASKQQFYRLFPKAADAEWDWATTSEDLREDFRVKARAAFAALSNPGASQ